MPIRSACLDGRSCRLRLLLALALCAQTGVALAAAEYFYLPRGNILMRADDNILLTPEDSTRVWGFDNVLAVELQRRTETLSSSLLPRVNVRRFPIGSEFDAEEFSVDFTNDYLGQDFDFGMDVGYARDSTLVTETTQLGLANNEIKYRDTLDASPSMLWKINERWQAQFSINYSDVSFLDAEDTGLIDFTFIQGTSTLNWLFDDKTQFFATFFTTDFDVPDVGNHTRTYGVQAGATRVLTPTITVTGAAGYVRSYIDFLERQPGLVFDPFPRLVIIETPQSAIAMGPIAQFSLQKRFSEASSARFDFSRQLSPNARGTQVENDRMELRADTKITENWLLMFSGNHTTQASQGDLFVTDANLDVSELRGAARYSINQEWSVTTAYRYAFRQNRDFSVSTAGGNSLSISIEYNGLPRPLQFLNGF